MKKTLFRILSFNLGIFALFTLAFQFDFNLWPPSSWSMPSPTSSRLPNPYVWAGESGGSSSSRIEYSDCIINWEWTEDGTITCEQTVTTYRRGRIQNQEVTEHTIKINLEADSNCDWDYDTVWPRWMVANVDLDHTCKIKTELTIEPELEWWKDIDWTDDKYRKVEVNDDSVDIDAWRVNPTGTKAVVFNEEKAETTEEFYIHKENDSYVIDIHDISSASPFKSDEVPVKIKVWWTEITLTTHFAFSKPYVWYVKVLNLKWDETDLEVWPTQILWVYARWSVTWVCPKSLKATNLEDTIQLEWSDKDKYELEIVWNEWTYSSCSGGKKIWWSNPPIWAIAFKLNYVWDWAIKDNADVYLSVKPIIEYTVDWRWKERKVNYYLLWNKDPEEVEKEWEESESEEWTTESWDSEWGCPYAWSSKLTTQKVVWRDKIEFLWWMVSAVWKGDLTNGVNSKVTLPLYEYRNQIRSDVLTSIRWMEDWEVSWKYKYVEGDYRASRVNIDWWNYNVLVIKDGNFIVDENLDNKKLAVVVLSTDPNDDESWNIYVKPNVTRIVASFYADGSIRSVDDSENLYTENTDERSDELDKQLIIEGSIISKNTIWGSILWEENTYILPGWIEIDADTATRQEKQEAFELDLNNLRVSNKGCDKNNDWDCTDEWEYTNNVVIKYNNVMKELLDF